MAAAQTRGHEDNGKGKLWTIGCWFIRSVVFLLFTQARFIFLRNPWQYYSCCNICRLSHLGPRSACVHSRSLRASAESQSGRQPAAANPPSYTYTSIYYDCQYSSTTGVENSQTVSVPSTLILFLCCTLSPHSWLHSLGMNKHGHCWVCWMPMIGKNH